MLLRTKRWQRQLNGLVALIVLITAFSCGKATTDVVIPKAVIQGIVEKKFPIEQNILLASAKLTSPVVYFSGTQIGVTIDYAAQLLTKPLAGQIQLLGSLTYNPAEAAFYVSQIQIASLTAPGADDQFKAQIQAALTNLLSGYLKGYPVYRLNPNDTKQSAAKLLLKAIRVENDQLIATLSLT